MSWKTSPLVRYKILELFGYTFGADHMYSRQRWEKLTQQVQTLLSQKRGTFSEIFITFSESTQSFAHFEKKDELHSLNNLEIIESEKYGYFSARECLFYINLRQ